MEKTLFTAGVLIGGLLQTAAAVWCLKLTEEKLPVNEKLPRNRLGGAILGMAALLVCVPHAQVVSPSFLLPFLYPLAVLIPILSYFFLDHCLARAVGGVMILWAYYWINTAFALNSPLLMLSAPAAWFWGALGIWISGKPWALRDWIRKASVNCKWRLCSAVILFIFALISILSAVTV